jgi:hypothetical protein
MCVQESWHTNDFSKQNADYFDPGCHYAIPHCGTTSVRSGGITHEDLRWHLHLFAIAIDRFLTHNTKECPRDRRKPLWLDILFALLADASLMRRRTARAFRSCFDSRSMLLIARSRSEAR